MAGTHQRQLLIGDLESEFDQGLSLDRLESGACVDRDVRISPGPRHRPIGVQRDRQTVMFGFDTAVSFDHGHTDCGPLETPVIARHGAAAYTSVWAGVARSTVGR